MIDPEKKQKLEETLEAYKEERDRQKGWLQRRFGCFGNIIAWVIVLVLGTLTYTFFDALESPWAYSFFGARPTLVGEWTGAFTTPSGMRGVVHIDLQHPYHQPSGNGSDTRWLEGTGASCIGSSAVQSYETFGRPNTLGTDVPLEFRQQAPYVLGYIIQSMRGSWSGDTLTLSGNLGHILDTANTTIVSGSDINQIRSVTITFRKGSMSDFQAACKTLGP